MIVVDRIEGSFAVCEFDDMSVRNIDIKNFDYTPKEGDCVFEKDGIFFFDEKATLERSEKMKRLMSDMFDMFK